MSQQHGGAHSEQNDLFIKFLLYVVFVCLQWIAALQPVTADIFGQVCVRCTQVVGQSPTPHTPVSANNDGELVAKNNTKSPIWNQSQNRIYCQVGLHIEEI